MPPLLMVDRSPSGQGPRLTLGWVGEPDRSPSSPKKAGGSIRWKARRAKSVTAVSKDRGLSAVSGKTVSKRGSSLCSGRSGHSQVRVEETKSTFQPKEKNMWVASVTYAAISSMKSYGYSPNHTSKNQSGGDEEYISFQLRQSTWAVSSLTDTPSFHQWNFHSITQPHAICKYYALSVHVSPTIYRNKTHSTFTAESCPTIKLNLSWFLEKKFHCRSS